MKNIIKIIFVMKTVTGKRSGRMKRLAVTFFVISFIFASTIMHATAAGSGQMSVFDKVVKETVPKNGVKEITYDQFSKIRKSGEQYVLLDVFSPDRRCFFPEIYYR
jgi:hypothetical protein